MKKKLRLEDVLSYVVDPVYVSVLYADDEEYFVPKDGDWRSIIPGRVQRMTVRGIVDSLIEKQLHIIVGTYDEVIG